MWVKPYVYRLVHRETKQFYIGYREANKIPANQDLPEYRSSSKTVKKMGFHNFDWEIIQEFDTGDEAYALEQRLIERNITNNLCLNRYYIKEGKKHFKFTKRHTEESKRKITNKLKGRKLSDTELADRRNRSHSEATKEKMRRHGIGRRYGAESRAKMSERAKARTNRNPPTTAKGFRLVSPTGEIFEGNGLAPFCKEHGLTQSSMAAVCRGEYKQHKGWTGEYIYEHVI